jgi:hypothetical protein
LINAEICGRKYVGGLAGYNHGDIIENSAFNGEINGIKAIRSSFAVTVL